MHIDITLQNDIIIMQGDITKKRGGDMRENLFLRIPTDLKRWLEQDAKERGLTLTGLIMALLSEYREQKQHRDPTV